MYAAYRTQAMAVWLFVLFNSAVHSIMYCYYAITALSLPFPRFLKKSITRMQITQFLVGGQSSHTFLADLSETNDNLANLFRFPRRFLSIHQSPRDLWCRQSRCLVLELLRIRLNFARTRHARSST